MNSNRSVIVLVGPIAAGKGTAAELLIQQGFMPFNYGDEIYKERTARGLKEERKISNAVGADLRLTYGNDIIAKRLAYSIEQFWIGAPGQRILIDGLRHPDEVVWMKKHLDAKVIGITATPEIRYQRALDRNRAVDPKSAQEFTAVDCEDRGVDSKSHENQSDLCVLKADVIVKNNDDDLEAYKQRIYEALRSLSLEKLQE